MYDILVFILIFLFVQNCRYKVFCYVEFCFIILFSIIFFYSFFCVSVIRIGVGESILIYFVDYVVLLKKNKNGCCIIIKRLIYDCFLYKGFSLKVNNFIFLWCLKGFQCIKINIKFIFRVIRMKNSDLVRI